MTVLQKEISGACTKNLMKTHFSLKKEINYKKNIKQCISYS
jgi:hypothetical protein